MSALFKVSRARVEALDGTLILLKPSRWIYRCDVCQRMGIMRTHLGAMSMLWRHADEAHGVRL